MKKLCLQRSLAVLLAVCGAMPGAYAESIGFLVDRPWKILIGGALIVAALVYSLVTAIMQRFGDAPESKEYNSELKELSANRKRDPDFSMEALETWVRDLYLHMQEDRETGDFSDLAGQLDPEFLEWFKARAEWEAKAELTKQRESGYTSRVGDVEVCGVSLIGWRERNGCAYLDLKLETQQRRAQIDADGKSDYENDGLSLRMLYNWRMYRPAGVKTDPTPRPCPKCGLACRRVLARCPRCATPLERDPQEWLLYDTLSREYD